MTQEKAAVLLAGLSYATVLKLKYAESGQLSIVPIKDDATERYAGVIFESYRMRRMVSSKAIFSSAEEAQEHMSEVLTAARVFDAFESKPNVV